MSAPRRAGEFGLGIIPYHTFGLGRAFALAGVRRAYGSDWHARGAEAVLATQRLDGSWYEGPADRADVLETCWQLLFLARAAVPVLPRPPRRP